MTGQQDGSRRDVSDADEDRTIEALRVTWGGVYDIGFAGGAWRAARLDGAAGLLTGQTPDGLAAAIRADWGAWGTPVTGPARPALRVAVGEPDQALRLAVLLAAHTDVVVEVGEFGTWQARIPEENGETIITRYRLGELLDKLDGIYPPEGGQG